MVTKAGAASDFTGRVALVTGAGRGLGLAYAQWLAARGAKVVVNNRVHADRPSAAKAAAEQITASGGIAVADEHAVESEAGAKGMVQTALDFFGRLDILICNAAVGSDGAQLQDVSIEDLRQRLEINLWGSLLPLHAALPSMIGQKYGRVVLTTSAAGLYGAKKSVGYATAKAALIGLARAVSIDNRDNNIMVNLVSPYARTEMAKSIDPKFSELLAPERVAPVVGKLASESCTRGGMIFAAGSGRVRRVALVEGPIGLIEDPIENLMPEIHALEGAYEPSSMTNSSLSLTPEIVGKPSPV